MGIIWGITIKLTKGNTRSSDHSSPGPPEIKGACRMYLCMYVCILIWTLNDETRKPEINLQMLASKPTLHPGPKQEALTRKETSSIPTKP